MYMRATMNDQRNTPCSHVLFLPQREGTQEVTFSRIEIWSMTPIVYLRSSVPAWLGRLTPDRSWVNGTPPATTVTANPIVLNRLNTVPAARSSPAQKGPRPQKTYGSKSRCGPGGERPRHWGLERTGRLRGGVGAPCPDDWGR